MEDINVEVLKEVVHEVVMKLEDHKEQLMDKVNKIKVVLFIYIYIDRALLTLKRTCFLNEKAARE